MDFGNTFSEKVVFIVVMFGSMLIDDIFYVFYWNGLGLLVLFVIVVGLVWVWCWDVLVLERWLVLFVIVGGIMIVFSF